MYLLPPPKSNTQKYLQATMALLDLVNTFDKWIDEIPPLPTPQRFGNLAFRTWGKRLEDVGLPNSSDLNFV